MPDPNNPNMPNPERKQESTIFTVVKEYTDKIDETVRDTYAWKQAFIEKARNSNNRYIQMLASCVLNGSVFGNTLEEKKKQIVSWNKAQVELKRIPDFDESILEEYAKYYLEALERFEKKLETDKKIRKYKKT